jgi:phosphoribosylaminoimidazole-succinocarboxamide synthase
LWPTDSYRVGTSPPSFDKQFVRDYLDSTGWNREPPPPELPDDVVMGTRARYIEAYELITGQSFSEWFGVE